MSSFVNLEYLTLSQVSLFDTSFQGLSRLGRLYLIECDLENFKSESFRYVRNLEHLDFKKSTKLNDINLKELNKLTFLRLTGFSKVFESLKNIKIVLYALHANLFKKLRHFETLKINLRIF